MCIGISGTITARVKIDSSTYLPLRQTMGLTRDRLPRRVHRCIRPKICLRKIHNQKQVGGPTNFWKEKTRFGLD